MPYMLYHCGTMRKARCFASHYTYLLYPFFLKCPVPIPECGGCYQIRQLYVWWRLFRFVFLFLHFRFPLVPLLIDL